jgi:hypothetical protein
VPEFCIVHPKPTIDSTSEFATSDTNVVLCLVRCVSASSAISPIQDSPEYVDIAAKWLEAQWWESILYVFCF